MSCKLSRLANEQRQMLVKRQEYLEKQIEDQMAIIRQNGIKNKHVSMQALKRKKQLEQQLGQNGNVLIALQTQRQALDEAKANTVIFNVMCDAGRVLKKTNKHLDIDKIEKLMDEVKEQQRIANKISLVISEPSEFDHDEARNAIKSPETLVMLEMFDRRDPEERKRTLAEINARLSETHKQDLNAAIHKRQKFANLAKALVILEAAKKPVGQPQTPTRVPTRVLTKETGREPGRPNVVPRIRKQFHKLIKVIKHSVLLRARNSAK